MSKYGIGLKKRLISYIFAENVLFLLFLICTANLSVCQVATNNSAIKSEKGVLNLMGRRNGPRFEQLPPLVQGELLHSFILASTGISADFPMVRRVLELTRSEFPQHAVGGIDRIKGAPKGNMINKSISISKEWEV